MLSQVQFLSKVIATGDYSVITMNNLDEEYFFNYIAEYKFIRDHYDIYRQVPDKLTFLDKFPDFDYIEVNEPFTYLLDVLCQDYSTNYLASKFNKMKQLLEGGQVDAALDYFTKANENLRRTSVLNCTNLLEDTSRYDRYMERTRDQSKFYISTGFTELDEIIGGLDLQNENLVISARTGQGKTQMMTIMAVAASVQGKRVAIYEGEMTKDKLGARIDTFLGHIKNSDINRGGLAIQREYEQYIKSLPNSGYGPIYVLTPTDVTGPVTVNVLRSFVEKVQADILFVDQYSLMEDLSKAKTSFERVGNIAKDIKKLQVEKQIPIVSIAQMNRTKNEDGSQDTTQIGLSDMIPQYATVLLMLDRKDDKLIINIVKSRDGGNGKLTYSCDFNTGYLTYIPENSENNIKDNTSDAIRESYESPISSSDTPF